MRQQTPSNQFRSRASSAGVIFRPVSFQSVLTCIVIHICFGCLLLKQVAVFVILYGCISIVAIIHHLKMKKDICFPVTTTSSLPNGLFWWLKSHRCWLRTGNILHTRWLRLTVHVLLTASCIHFVTISSVLFLACTDTLSLKLCPLIYEYKWQDCSQNHRVKLPHVFEQPYCFSLPTESITDWQPKPWPKTTWSAVAHD